GTRTADHDLGNAAILPGLVNAHTHLDLSGLRGKCPPTPDFTDWLRKVITYRRAQLTEQVDGEIATGLKESTAYGTTVIGDIVADPGDLVALAPRALRSVVFKEILGLPFSRVQPAWESAIEWLLSRHAITLPPFFACDAGMTRWGLSPHAPYSVHRSLFRRIASRARHERFPLSIHLAETASELELLSFHRGPFVDFLAELNVWNPEGLVASPDEIIGMIAGAGPTLLVHCNYLPLGAPIPPNATIVYCPRTHAAFGHPPHPFREFLA